MKNRYSILAALSLVSALLPFSGNSINLAIKDISSDLGMQAVAATWIISALMLPSAILQIPFGKLADRKGRKLLLLLGISLFSLASFGCALATGGVWLLLMRFVQGVGSAMFAGISIALITNVFPANQRGKAIGINTSAVYLALALGPVVGGLLTHYWGWRSLFVAMGSLGFLACIGILVFMQGMEWKESDSGKFDFKGMGLYSLAMVGILWGFSLLPSLGGFALAAAGLIAFPFFVNCERRQTQPMFDMNMFLKNRLFRMSSFAALINYASTFSISFLISLYLQYIKGFDPQTAGFIMLAQPVSMFLLSPVAGKYSDRFDAGKIATAGMCIIVVCLALLLFLSPSTPLWVLTGILVSLGAGFGIFSSPNTNVIMGSVSKPYWGTASAATGTVRQVGQALSMGLTMLLISVIVGNKVITPALYPALMHCIRCIFLVFMLLCCLGVYCSMARNR
jgi:MFS family permease